MSKWKRRADKVRKRRRRMVEHGRAFGRMVADAARKRNRRKR